MVGKLGLWLFSLSFFSCTPEPLKVPYYADASFTPIWNCPDREAKDIHRIGAFNLTDQFSHAITAETMKGKIFVADFFFTSCPSICPRMTANMKKVFEEFKGNKNVGFLSHSVTPAIDNPARLNAYARRNGVLSQQWHFLTGSKAEIYALARKRYFIEEEAGLSKDSTSFLHTESFILVDGEGHIRGLYNGTMELETGRIAEDIRYLLEEKAGGL